MASSTPTRTRTRRSRPAIAPPPHDAVARSTQIPDPPREDVGRNSEQVGLVAHEAGDDPRVDITRTGGLDNRIDRVMDRDRRIGKTRHDGINLTPVRILVANAANDIGAVLIRVELAEHVARTACTRHEFVSVDVAATGQIDGGALREGDVLAAQRQHLDRRAFELGGAGRREIPLNGIGGGAVGDRQAAGRDARDAAVGEHDALRRRRNLRRAG